MIDNYLLEELVTFAKFGTLAKAAEELNLSQPALTRGTQKIEDQLGIKIFDRSPNKIQLNQTGQYAAKRAEKVLKANQNYLTEVRNFDSSNKQVTLASNAPGPLILIKSLKKDKLKIKQKLLKHQNFTKLLLEHQYTCIITNKVIKNSQIESMYLGMENLTVHLNEFSPLASKHSVTFRDLKSLIFLVLRDIGFWKEIIQTKIPDAKFLYQDQIESFNEIKNYSIFPFFTTNITTVIGKINPKIVNKINQDRVAIKISDKIAKQTFYANYLKQNKKRLEPLIEKWQDAWEKVD